MTVARAVPCGLCIALLAVTGSTPFVSRDATANKGPALDLVQANDNRTPAGVLRDGVLTVRLEARVGEWHPDGDSDPGVEVRAFAEEGRPLQIPGPLIRVPEGTEVHASIRNGIEGKTLVVRGLSQRGIASASPDTARNPFVNLADSVHIPFGAVREVRFTAGAPGTYYYTGSARATFVPRGADDSQLSGAIVVDPRDARRAVSDRIFVLGLWGDSATATDGGAVRFVINGKSWPHTERLAYDLGDTIRFRLINTSVAVHPMHLHGFYFRVESRGDGRTDNVFDAAASPQYAVTERVAPFRTTMISWVPERAGNWLFHCHDNVHIRPEAPLTGGPRPAANGPGHDHALQSMGGLVLGMHVRAPGGAPPRVEPVARRRLRLVARVDSGGSDAEPAYGFVLSDGAKPAPGKPLLPGPTIVLKRGEPVGITVVNELQEPTAVHWHGIELESYFDGVAGFAGQPGRLAPVIAPRDSFEARFTPPRAGTFIYHTHVDEVRQQRAGLAGALLVLESDAKYDPETDIVALISTPRAEVDRTRVYLNGTTNPAPRDLRAGTRYRLRVINIHTYRPSMRAELRQDTTITSWRALAKDGMDLPADRAIVRRATQQLGNGETYDFEFVPATPGPVSFQVRAGNGGLLVSLPLRVN